MMVAEIILGIGFVVYIVLLVRDIHNYNKMMREWNDDE